MSSGIQVELLGNGRYYSEKVETVFPYYYKDNKYNVMIIKFDLSMIVFITTNVDVNNEILLELSLHIVKFDMLFAGLFMGFATERLAYKYNAEYKPDKKTTESLLLNFYNSHKELKAAKWEFPCYPNKNDYPDKLKEWIALTDELEIIHQMFLYMNADLGMPVDTSFMLFIQCFQPLAELLKSKGKVTIIPTGYKCDDGSKVATFKDFLKSITDLHSNLFFEKEINAGKWDAILQKIVNTRNQIAHVIPGKKNILTGEQCRIYHYKFFLLYRTVLLNLLGIPLNEFEIPLKNYIASIDDCYGILSRLLS